MLLEKHQKTRVVSPLSGMEHREPLKPKTSQLVPRSAALERGAAQNRTTVAAKGVNGSKKTVITIRKVYGNKPGTPGAQISQPAPKPKLLSPFKRQAKAHNPVSLLSKPHATTNMVRSREQTPLGIDLTLDTSESLPDSASTETDFTDAAECFGIEMPVSPSSTLHDDCPALKSPSFSGKSSVGSLDTVLAEDMLDQWGIPEVARQSSYYGEENLKNKVEASEEEPEEEPEELPLHLYGIGSDPELLSYYESDIFLERSMKVDQIRYMSLIVLAYKLKLKQQKKAAKAAQLNRELQVQRDRHLLNNCLSFFGSWI